MLRSSASSSSSAAAAAAAACLTTHDDAVAWMQQHYHAVPADGRCWWTCTSHRLGASLHQLQVEIKAAVQDVRDVETMCAVELHYLLSLRADEVERIKARFLHEDSDFSKFKNGGRIEMLLLCKARGGAIGFVCISGTHDAVQSVYYVPPRTSAADARQRVRQWIVLHHCSSKGFRTERNHWNLFLTSDDDGSAGHSDAVAGYTRLAAMGEYQTLHYAREHERTLERTVAFFTSSRLDIPPDQQSELVRLKHDIQQTQSLLPLGPPPRRESPASMPPSRPLLQARSTGVISLSSFLELLTPVLHMQPDGGIEESSGCSVVEVLGRGTWSTTGWRLPTTAVKHAVSAEWSRWQSHEWNYSMPIPFALLPDTTDDLRASKADPQHVKPHPVRVIMSFARAALMHRRVSVAHSILATVIHDHTPVHFYVQFISHADHAAWATSQAEQCRAEFQHEFKCFLAELCTKLGDEELLQRLQLQRHDAAHDLWLRQQPDGGAMEMQFHRCNVAFSLADLALLMHRFRVHLEAKMYQRAQRGEPPALLCRIATESRIHPVSLTMQPVECVQHLIHFQAYQPGHLLCLPGHHAPGSKQRLLPWTRSDGTGATLAGDSAAMQRRLFMAMPHVSVPTQRCRDEATAAVEPNNWDAEPFWAAREDEEGGGYNSIWQASNDLRDAVPTVVDLRALRTADADGCLDGSIYDAVLPLSKRVTECVSLLLMHHLSRPFRLRLCERDAAFSCVRGFIELQQAMGATECPCCNRPKAPADEAWDREHTSRAIPFTLGRSRLTLYCPARQHTHFDLALKHRALLRAFVAFGVTDFPTGFLPGASAATEQMPLVRAAVSLTDAQLQARIDAPLFMPRTGQERHAMAMREYELASPELRALLNKGSRTRMRWNFKECTPEDYQPDPLSRGPSTVIGPWIPQTPTVEECIEDETGGACKRDDSLEQHVDDELERDVAYVRERFGPDHLELLFRKRLCLTDAQRDRMVQRMMQFKFILIKAAQGGGKSWLLDEAIKRFVAQHPEARILWVSCKRMYGMATYLRLKQLRTRLAAQSITFEFQIYLHERWKRSSTAATQEQPKGGRKRRQAPSSSAYTAASTSKRLKVRESSPTSATGASAFAVPEAEASGMEGHDMETSEPAAPSVDRSRLGDQQAMVGSLESIERLQETEGGGPPRPYDLIVLDELEDLRYNFHSSKTMGDKRLRVFNHLKLLLQQASFVWATDADLDVSRENSGGIRFLEAMMQPSGPSSSIESPRRFYLIWNRYDSVRRDYLFHPRGPAGEPSCVTALVRLLLRGERAVVVTNSREKAKYLAHHCRNHPQLVEMFASGKLSATVLTGDTPQDDKWRFMKDKNLWRVQLLIYSPVISSGVDYSVPEWTRPWFHEAFLFAVDASSTVRQMFQQLNRVRQLIRNRVHVHLDTTPLKWAALPDTFDAVAADTAASLQRCRKDYEVGGYSLLVRPEDIDPQTRQTTLNLTASGAYNTVYILNQLEVNRSRRHFERLLVCAMLMAGGYIFQIQYPVSAEEQQRMRKDLEHVRKEECERIAGADNWTQEQVKRAERAERDTGARLGPAARRAVAKCHLTSTYGVDAAAITPEFVRTYQSQSAMHRFQCLHAQAKDGSAAIRAAMGDRVRNGADAPEHCLAVFTCDMDAQTLLTAAGFVKVVAATDQRRADDSRHRAGMGTIAAEPVGDLFTVERIRAAAIEQRLAPGSSSQRYWWARLLQVQSFQAAILARKRKNEDSFRAAKRKLIAQGCDARQLATHEGLTKWEVRTSPQDWSGAMMRKVLIDALRSFLRQKFGLRVSTSNDSSGPVLRLNHSFWEPMAAALTPSSRRFDVPQRFSSVQPATRAAVQLALP
jgi:hypothetical protein